MLLVPDIIGVLPGGIQSKAQLPISATKLTFADLPAESANRANKTSCPAEQNCLRNPNQGKHLKRSLFQLRCMLQKEKEKTNLVSFFDHPRTNSGNHIIQPKPFADAVGGNICPLPAFGRTSCPSGRNFCNREREPGEGHMGGEVLEAWVTKGWLSALQLHHRPSGFFHGSPKSPITLSFPLGFSPTHPFQHSTAR